MSIGFMVKDKSQSPYADKTHVMSSGRQVRGVSHAWARELDISLARILDASPDIRHVSILVPKADGDVRRLFHLDEGGVWQQVHLKEFGTRRFDIQAIVRGAQEIDGDPAFPTALTREGLVLREIAGRMLLPAPRRPPVKVDLPGSLAEWVERQLRQVLDHAAELYVEGATSEQARNGRRQSLVTIERHIRHLRAALRPEEPFAWPEQLAYEAQIGGQLERFLVRRHVPFLTEPRDLISFYDGLTKGRKKEIAKGLWADAARVPRSADFREIYGAILRQAEGHPVYGDEDYQRLEALLAQDLAAGYRVVRLGGRLFIRHQDRWHPARVDPLRAGQAQWSHGLIISRNHGRLIVPPHLREGELVPGYTRNGPGEGASSPRERPVEMRCIDRPIPDTNLHWLHAYHAWELEQG